MSLSGPVWVDEGNPIYRRGLVACLQAEGYAVAGESVGLQPAPDLAAISLLIFDVDGADVEQVCSIARRCDVGLIGLARETSAERNRELRKAGLSALLVLRTLTPSRLTACIQAIAEQRRAEAEEASAQDLDSARAYAGKIDERNLTHREFDVLCLLAEGGSTRDIAEHLSYSERTVKNIVHDVLAKLNGRTRAHAVAVAARQGLI